MEKKIYEKPKSDVLRFGRDLIIDAANTSPPDTLISDPWGDV